MTIYPTAQLVAMLEALTGADAPFDGLDLRLFQNNVLPNANSVIGDFTEADFTGYVKVTLDPWEAVFRNPQGQAEVHAPSVTFSATGDTTANTIYGWYLTSGTDPLVLHASALLREPVEVVDALSAVPVDPILTLNN